MKTLVSLLTFVFSLTFAQAQLYHFYMEPAPITNAVEWLPADPDVLAGLYYAPGLNAPESSLQLVPNSTSAVGLDSMADFDAAYMLFGVIGTQAPVTIQVRAWSPGFVSYESAVGSGLSSVLAGKSSLANAMAYGTGSVPPIVNYNYHLGLAMYQVPEPSAASLIVVFGVVAKRLIRRRY